MQIKQIACCTDFSENAEASFNAALELAEKYRARFYVLHVMPPVINPLMTDSIPFFPEEPAGSILSKLEERMQQEYGARITSDIEHKLIVLEGHISTEILRFLKDNQIDIVVMGSYGFTGMGLVFFGSVAKRVSHKTPCSVLIVRAQEQEKIAV
jgi:universal stress protein A